MIFSDSRIGREILSVPWWLSTGERLREFVVRFPVFQYPQEVLKIYLTTISIIFQPRKIYDKRVKIAVRILNLTYMRELEERSAEITIRLFLKNPQVDLGLVKREALQTADTGCCKDASYILGINITELVYRPSFAPHTIYQPPLAIPPSNVQHHQEPSPERISERSNVCDN
uniref:Uncharacterized protein n=1 Tax=Glossina pallidipes TaxID=7398 RepID=A0A1B0ADH1_GLOPL